MARKTEPDDETMIDRIRAAFEDQGIARADELAGIAFEAVKPMIGAAAQRRRDEGLLRNVFKDGFLMGKKSSRSSPWHPAIWRCSASGQAFHRKAEQSEQSRELQELYERYNF